VKAWLVGLAWAALVQGDPAPVVVEPAPIDWLARLAPRSPVAGMRGFECVSVVKFAAEPTTPHELTCTYVFPDRVRWQLRVRGQDEFGRHIEYRCGDAYFVLAQGETQATEVSSRTAEAAALTSKCESMELRRALFLWPDGFEWIESGDVRRAKSTCGREIEARMDSDGRPQLVRWANADAASAESLSVAKWSERLGRWWPESLELQIGAERIWTESVESVATSVQLLDQFFLPPNLRPDASTARTRSTAIHVDTPSRHEFRFTLPTGCDWELARTRWDAEVAKLVASLPTDWKVAPGAYAEVDSNGRPIALLVRVRGVGQPPPGAAFAPSQPALLTAARWPGVDVAGSLRRLAELAPAGAELGGAYVGFQSALAADGELQIVAVLRAKR